MIRKFDEYINENLFDKMTDKSDEEIKAALGDTDKITPQEKIAEGIKSQIPWLIQLGFDEIKKSSLSKKILYSHKKLLYSYLMNSIRTNNPEIVKTVLDNDILPLSRQHTTYLYTNVLNIGNVNILKILIEYGLNIDDISNNISVFYDTMEFDDNYDIVKFIIDNSPKIKSHVKNTIDDLESNAEKMKKFL